MSSQLLSRRLLVSVMAFLERCGRDETKTDKDTYLLRSIEQQWATCCVDALVDSLSYSSVGLKQFTFTLLHGLQPYLAFITRFLYVFFSWLSIEGFVLQFLRDSLSNFSCQKLLNMDYLLNNVYVSWLCLFLTLYKKKPQLYLFTSLYRNRYVELNINFPIVYYYGVTIIITEVN